MGKYDADVLEMTNMEERIKKHLLCVFGEEFYYRWVEDFVFEKIEKEQIVIGYLGKESFAEFEKEFKDEVIKEIKEIADDDKTDVKIVKRTGKTINIGNEKLKRNLKIAKLFVISLFFVCITMMIALIGCNYISNRTFKESFYSVSSIKSDDKIRVIQISDLHNSIYGKNNKKLIDRVKKLKPDIILYTGDCVDSGKKSIERIAQLCGELSKTAPSYYIYGNNEVELFYDVLLNQDALDEKFGFDDKNRNPDKLTEIEDALEKELKKKGVKVLKNEMDSIKIGSTEVDIFGVLTSNPSSFWSYAGKNYDKFIYENTSNMKIMAIHEPFVFEEYSPDFWGDLMVCGHTHGGTMKVPVLGPLYTHEGGFLPARKGGYVYGRYDVSGKPLIVSSGLDNKNIFRINNKPELVIIDVNRF